ncbi:ArsR/SmtB family transcription factor [Sporosarcina contaminans]|uniref:ArsR/SmtB family transcription factor n=1 Tax=Sporosarcina contaminans TaxID=633403 RepID=A0ABW3TY92_9BACL
MNTLSITGKKRESYQIEFEHSLLWESALGIAAITNIPLLDTLEKEKEFEKIISEMPGELKNELDYVEKNNTWKSLLQLLHMFNGSTLEQFTEFIQQLSAEELCYNCLPYIGNKLQKIRRQASKGDLHAMNALQKATKDNPFFPSYIEFIFHVDKQQLKKHLCDVITLWYNLVIFPQSEELFEIIERDLLEKRTMAVKMNAEEFVAWATNGSEYIPEPGVYRVLFIPQMTYRPWTIVSDIEGTKVFYYPIPNYNIYPNDPYLPDYLLIQKFKALGDEVRLRMVKLLSEDDYTLKEISERLDLGKSTAHHHLKILRAASLVGIKTSKYTIKENSVTSLSKELQLYLKQ